MAVFEGFWLLHNCQFHVHASFIFDQSVIMKNILLISIKKKNLCIKFTVISLARHGLQRCTCAMCGRTCACACEMTYNLCVQCACVQTLLSWSHTTHVRPHLTTNLRWSHFTPCTRPFCKLTFFQQFLGVPKQNRMF